MLIELIFRNKTILKKFFLLLVVQRHLIDLANYVFLFFINNEPTAMTLFSPTHDLLYWFLTVPTKDLIIVSKLLEDGWALGSCEWVEKMCWLQKHVLHLLILYLGGIDEESFIRLQVSQGLSISLSVRKGIRFYDDELMRQYSLRLQILADPYLNREGDTTRVYFLRCVNSMILNRNWLDLAYSDIEMRK